MAPEWDRERIRHGQHTKFAQGLQSGRGEKPDALTCEADAA